MNLSRIAIAGVFLTMGSQMMWSQAWSGILDSSRATNWTTVGIPGGIPNRTAVCSTIDAATYSNGTADATSGIQAALNSCGADRVVVLTAGKFRIGSSLRIPSNVTLRGAGADQTILDARGSAAAVINFGTDTTPSTGNSTAINGGATAGSTTLTLASATGVSTGTLLMITQLNDPAYVNITGDQGTCGWCDGGIGWGGTRAAGQIVEVTAVSGSTVTVSPALYITYSQSPLATRFTAGARYAGVENLQVYANNTGYTANFRMGGSAYSWIKGVESNYSDGDHVQAHWSFRGEIRDSYFHDGFLHTSGNTDTDIFIVNKSSAFLVENNILDRLHVSIMLNWGAAGNVIAYNYSDGAFDQNATNASLGDFSMHGAHPMFNLWEGNVATSFHPDSMWGSSSHNTAFRNWFRGTNKVSNPTTGRSALTGTPWWLVQAIRAVSLDWLGRYYNLVGNVIGGEDMASLKKYNGTIAMGQVASITAPQDRSYDSVAYGYTFGYANLSDGGGYAGNNSLPLTTAIIHGDYVHASNAVTWSSSISTRTLPASFYLSGKPSWWGSLPWPANGPEITGGIGGRGHANGNPAQSCYTRTARDTNGVLRFNAQSCYGGSTSVLLLPPLVSVLVK